MARLAGRRACRALRMPRHALALAAATAIVLPAAVAQTGPSSTTAPAAAQQVTITSTLPGRLDDVPGSSVLITRQRLEAERAFSVREVLQGVAGVHVVGEDAFGVNLNIGVRGLDPRRSARTLLLEDGMPIHLAPYSDPSAHYHTPLERLHAVEVLKGSGQIVHGPQTVGGVINFVTRPVPQSGLSAGGELALGNRGFRRVAAHVGQGSARGGWLIEAAQREGDGSRVHHHHRITDLSLKGALQLSPAHGLSLKLGHYTEDSRFSEAGLDQARFEANPLGNAFRHDVFELERTALQAVHRWTLTPTAQLATQVYAAKVFRASYRQLDAIAEFEGVVEEADGTLVAELELQTLRSRAPDTGARNPACRLNGAGIDYRVPGGFETYAAACGNQMRPRDYLIYGIEPRLTVSGRLFGLSADWVAGLRLHHEDIERRRYNGVTPDAREHSPGTYFRDRNDIDTEATAAYVQTTLSGRGWTVTPGVRFERYTQRNTAVLAREDRDANNGKVVRLSHDKLLPGIGATWQALPQATLFAGLHRGFAPPRPDANLSPTDDDYVPVNPEVSTNLELGLRSRGAGALQWEAALFHIDFKNQIVPGYAVGLGQTFANAGASTHAGLELSGRWQLGQRGGLQPYVSAGWTWLKTARFDSRLMTPHFAPGETDSEDFRDARGKRLPYAPEHTVALALGVAQGQAWDARIGLTHVSRQFSDALNSIAPDPNGQSGAIPAFTTLNAAVNMRLPAKGLSAYLSVSNLTDRRYLVSRVNGAVAGAPRQVVAGLRLAY